MPLHVAQSLDFVAPIPPQMQQPAGDHPSPPPGRVRRVPSVVAGLGVHIPYTRRRGVPTMWRAPAVIILVVVALTSGGVSLLNSKHFAGSSTRYLRAPGSALSDDSLSADWYGGAGGSRNSSGLSRATNHTRTLIAELQELPLSSPGALSHGGSRGTTPATDAVTVKQSRLLAIMRELMDMAEADHTQAKEGAAAATAARVAPTVVASSAVPVALSDAPPLAAAPQSAVPAGAAEKLQPSRAPEPQQQHQPQHTKGVALANTVLNPPSQPPPLLSQPFPSQPPPLPPAQQLAAPPPASSAPESFRTRLAQLQQQQRLAAKLMTAQQILDAIQTPAEYMLYPSKPAGSVAEQQALAHQFQVRRWHHQQQHGTPQLDAVRRSPLQLQIIGIPVEVLPPPDTAAVASAYAQMLATGQSAVARQAAPVAPAPVAAAPVAGTAPSPSAAPLPTSVYDTPAFDPVPPTGFDPTTGESLALSRPRDAGEASARTQFFYGCVNAGREPLKQRGSQAKFINTDRAFLRLHAFWVHHSTRHLRDRPAFTW